MTFNPVNILNVASSLIPTVRIETREFISMETDEMGRRVPKYEPWTFRRGHVQPGSLSSFGTLKASEHDYRYMGQELSESKVGLYCPWRPKTSSEAAAPDQLRWDGRVFNCIDRVDWHGYSGWSACVFEEQKGEDGE